MIKQLSLLTGLCAGLFMGCSAQTSENAAPPAMPEALPEVISDAGGVQSFRLSDYYRDSKLLDEKVDALYARMEDKQRVGQMIVPAVGRLGKPDSVVEALVKQQLVGGVLLLNGTTESFKNYVQQYDSLMRAQAGVPLIYSADAEPSLINRKIADSPKVPKTNQLLDSASIASTTATINAVLRDIGILYNYMPVVDLSVQNQAIGNRSLGTDPEEVAKLARVAIRTSQDAGIAATAKHFPGHGLVKGDSHHKLVYIDGEMKELPVYKPLIDAGVVSVMVGHIAVENNAQYNTQGMPATLSSEIVSGLLRNELGFDGIITTDAMNMGAVAAIPNASFKAVQAGCDMILMPLDEQKLAEQILQEMKANATFRKQVEASVKRILRLKVCAGLIR